MKRFIKKHLANVPASIVVFLVALPLCLGIALGSQAPLFSGIISGIIGGIIIGFLSGSQLSVSGPAAGLIAIVVIGLEKLGSFEAFLLATFIAGIFQLAFGFLKLGTLGNFIPNAVIKGMLAAIGVILIIKQIPHFVGYDKNSEIDESFLQNEQVNAFFDAIHIASHLEPLAILIGIVSLLILLFFSTSFFKKSFFLKFIPSPLIAVIIGCAINYFFILTNSKLALHQEHLVSLPQLNSFFDLNLVLAYPKWNAVFNFDVWIIAVTIALVASIETLLCIEATDKLDPFRRVTNGNRELKAQGVGNALSGLIGGLPITSVIVRSSANVNAGAKSKLSAILHGFWLLFAVILIPNLLNKIPYSALAAILILTGYKLTKPEIFKTLYKSGFDQFIPFIITIFAILLTNLLLGIVIGIVVSFIAILYSNFKSSIMLVNKGNHYLLRLRKDVSFLNKSMLKETLEKVPASSHILIDVSRSDFIDKDVIEVINDFVYSAPLKRIKVEIKKGNFKALHKLIR